MMRHYSPGSASAPIPHCPPHNCIVPATSSRWMCHRVILASYGDPHAHQSSVMNRGKLLSTFKVDTFIKFSRKMVLSSLVLHACITFTLLSNKELDTFYEEYRVSYPPIINALINNDYKILSGYFGKAFYAFLRSWIHGYGIKDVCLPVLYCLDI